MTAQAHPGIISLMAHHPQPRYRDDRGYWFVNLPAGGGRYAHKILIHGPREATEAEAYKAYHRAMAEQGREPIPRPDLTIAMACELFLEQARVSVKPNSYEQYRIKLQDFVDRCGAMRLDRLGATHVTSWLKSHEWSDSTRRGGLTAVKVFLNWCVRQKHLAESPARDLKRPRMKRRERTLNPAERKAVRAAFRDSFGDFLDALTWTGARPGEIMRLEAAHIDWDAAYASLAGKTTDVTGDKIEFPLTRPMLALCRRLAEEHPNGPLFRNSEGNPWTVNAVRCRMRRMRGRIGIGGVTAYTYRHSYATDKLQGGMPVTDLSALMNHKDVRTTMNYSHITERRAHLSNQAERFTDDPEGASNS